MGEILFFKTKNGQAVFGTQKRRLVTGTGCNEPFKDRFWCPKKRWFMRSRCPFINKWECHNFSRFCGGEI